jgi:hypothetical protein
LFTAAEQRDLPALGVRGVQAAVEQVHAGNQGLDARGVRTTGGQHRQLLHGVGLHQVEE